MEVIIEPKQKSVAKYVCQYVNLVKTKILLQTTANNGQFDIHSAIMCNLKKKKIQKCT